MRQAKHEMDKFVQNISGHPEKRENASPYYLLHEAGQAVYGTVLMFHGFSATTWQTSLLAQYLFDNGFNVYQPSLCGHYFVNPDKNWPKVLPLPHLSILSCFFFKLYLEADLLGFLFLA